MLIRCLPVSLSHLSHLFSYIYILFLFPLSPCFFLIKNIKKLKTRKARRDTETAQRKKTNLSVRLFIVSGDCFTNGSLYEFVHTSTIIFPSVYLDKILLPLWDSQIDPVVRFGNVLVYMSLLLFTDFWCFHVFYPFLFSFIISFFAICVNSENAQKFSQKFVQYFSLETIDYLRK